jgi:hypothetical protein
MAAIGAISANFVDFGQATGPTVLIDPGIEEPQRLRKSDRFYRGRASVAADRSRFFKARKGRQLHLGLFPAVND